MIDNEHAEKLNRLSFALISELRKMLNAFSEEKGIECYTKEFSPLGSTLHFFGIPGHAQSVLA